MIIISASAPRAGSSWYYHMITALLLEAGFHNAEILHEKYGWLFTGATRNMNIGILYGTKLLCLTLLAQLFGSFAIKTHAKPTRVLRLLSRYKLAKSVFICRDPRVRLVSIMSIAAKQRENGMVDRSFAHISGFEDALKEVSPSYQHYRVWENNPETMLIRFEDFVQNRSLEIKRTADFLEPSLNLEQVEAGLAAFDFSVSKERSHFVRGEIGN